MNFKHVGYLKNWNRTPKMSLYKNRSKEKRLVYCYEWILRFYILLNNLYSSKQINCEF